MIPLSLTSAMLAEIRSTEKEAERTTKQVVFVVVVSVLVIVSLINNLLSLEIFLLRDVRRKKRTYIQGANIRENNIRENNIRENNIRRDNIRRDNIRRDNIRRDNIRRDNIRENNIRGDNIRGGNIREDNIRENNIRGDNIRGGNIREDNIRGDNILFLILYSVCSIIVALELQTRVILMLFDRYSSAGYTFYSCNIAPVVSTMLIHLGLWLSAAITVERLLFDIIYIEVIGKQAHKRTVIIMILMPVIVFITHIHEIFGRQAVPDPGQPGSFVCTFDYDKKWLNSIDDWLSTLHLALPCFIHSVCFITTLWRLGHEKGTGSYCKLSLTGLKKNELYLIPPVLIVVCCLPHFIFAHLMYHCIELSHLGYLHLHVTLNLFIFIPQALTFFIYILPSTVYMDSMQKTTGGRLIKCLFAVKQESKKQEKTKIELNDI
ncbi:unnamed protein product [Rotaria socialis]|uniref:G-protein coupled receptors family 1 profile domain-containing protein n=1 Tax=Rotaria socialis TaxID=392032 RepID=A0A818FMB1_9BILA|nr:unnamed protein product [Rotaria socialis]CAF4280570.1 unnamed protein product [Rotaria socialis]